MGQRRVRLRTRADFNVVGRLQSGNLYANEMAFDHLISEEPALTSLPYGPNHSPEWMEGRLSRRRLYLVDRLVIELPISQPIPFERWHKAA
jgi:hypothetical protein